MNPTIQKVFLWDKGINTVPEALTTTEIPFCFHALEFQDSTFLTKVQLKSICTRLTWLAPHSTVAFFSCQSSQPSLNFPWGGKPRDKQQQPNSALNSSAGVWRWKENPFVFTFEHMNQTLFLFESGLLLKSASTSAAAEIQHNSLHPKNALTPAFVICRIRSDSSGNKTPTLRYLAYYHFIISNVWVANKTWWLYLSVGRCSRTC